MANTTINALTSASTIDPVNDLLPIYQNSTVSTLAINRNTYLGLSSAPVGLTDSQTLTNKTLTSPTISNGVISGTVTGTYTLGGTPTFPATVVQTTASQTLTNKTLTSPSITSPTITNATISADAITGYTTSNAGTIFGLSISGGTLNGSSITANTITASQIANSTITNTQIASGGLYTSKVYNPYKFSAYLNAAQNSINGFTKVLLDTKLFDTSSNFDAVTNRRFTAPVAGFYQFTWAVAMGAAASTVWQACLYKNGVIIKYGSLVDISSAYQQSVGAGFLQLAANDYIELYIYASAAVALGPGNFGTFLDGFLVSTT